MDLKEELRKVDLSVLKKVMNNADNSYLLPQAVEKFAIPGGNGHKGQNAMLRLQCAIIYNERLEMGEKINAPEREKPQMIESFDFNNYVKLRSACQEYIDFIWGPNYHEDSDHTHFIAEEALKAVFGEDIYNYINKKTE